MSGRPHIPVSSPAAVKLTLSLQGDPSIGCSLPFSELSRAPVRETLTEGSPSVSWGRLGSGPLTVQSCSLSFYIWLCKGGSQHAGLSVCVRSSEFSVQNSRSLNCWSLRSAFWEQQQQHRGQVRKSMWKRRRLIKETFKTCGCQPALKIPNLTVAQICSEKPGLLGRLTVKGSTCHSKHTDPSSSAYPNGHCF